MWAAAGGLWGSRAGLRVLLRSRDAALVPDCARGLHGSAVSCKNWLKKFASKTKKKFWYEGPSLGSHLVSLTPDFSACRVYWKTTLSAEQNARTETVLQKSAAHMRHLLMSQQTLRNVPPIVFVKDKQSAALAEIDQLLAVADFGPPDQRDDFVRNDFRNLDAPRPCGTTEPATSSSLCGIDHEALNKQIMEYKRRKDKGLGGLVWQGQVAELTAQMKKGRKKAKRVLEQDSSLKSYLSGEEGEDDLDLDGTLEYECSAPDTEELEAERRGSITEDDRSCRARGE
ncbi:putative ribosome-binding factor A, mitochondrial isoform X2 [Callithrix jacchus]|uniref:putative ribosome-binding factor A, mitochondrial isoform X2 n=1 Tax=Callithrix jacchus TaxID=9483 RepID=UPI00159D2B84|nr:putative ribosome-binding factor A, mitochondrial isoform X2 [Callithrix jacchus]